MGQNTSRLGLYLPGGGSTGLITPDEPADIDKINDNMTKLDIDAGAYVCTSSTRPSSPYNGKIIFETDTRKTMIYKSATTSWEPVDSQGKIVANAAARDALFASPVQGTKVFRTDLGVTETYYAEWNSSTNPGGETPAGWYVAERSTGLVPMVPTTILLTPPGGTAVANSLGEISFSNTTSVSLNNVFSSTYRNYRVLLNVHSIATVAGAFGIRLRSGTTDYSTNNHTSQYANFSAGTLNVTQATTSSYIATGQADTSALTKAIAAFDISNPNVAVYTAVTGTASGYSGGFFTGFVPTTTQYTGFTILTASLAAFSGTVQVFGYNA